VLTWVMAAMPIWHLTIFFLGIHVPFLHPVLDTLTFKQPAFTYVNACKKKTPVEINFVYLHIKKVYCIFDKHIA
jgi:hypothetical protein